MVKIALEENSYTLSSYCSGEKFHTVLWTFTRVIMSYLPKDVEPEEAFELVDQAIQELGGWRGDWISLDGIYSTSCARAEFLYVWDRVEYRLGEGPLDVALRRAERMPLLPEGCEDSEEPYARFISTAGWLQDFVGDKNIMLPCELLGALLGVSAMHISRLRAMAVKDGYLREVEKHSALRHRATEFRFSKERFPDLVEGW